MNPFKRATAEQAILGIQIHRKTQTKKFHNLKRKHTQIKAQFIRTQTSLEKKTEEPQSDLFEPTP